MKVDNETNEKTKINTFGGSSNCVLSFAIFALS